MPLKNRAQVRKYIPGIATLMGLSEWTITVSDKVADDGYSATVNCVEGRKSATIEFSEGFFKSDAVEQRSIVCHELLHCHHSQPDTITTNAIHHDVEPQWRLAMEYAIDGAATAWARMLPLP